MEIDGDERECQDQKPKIKTLRMKAQTKTRVFLMKIFFPTEIPFPTPPDTNPPAKATATASQTQITIQTQPINYTRTTMIGMQEETLATSMQINITIMIMNLIKEEKQLTLLMTKTNGKNPRAAVLKTCLKGVEGDERQGGCREGGVGVGGS